MQKFNTPLILVQIASVPLPELHLCAGRTLAAALNEDGEDNHRSKSVAALPALRSPSLNFSCVDALETLPCIVFIIFLLAVTDDSDNRIYRALKK